MPRLGRARPFAPKFRPPPVVGAAAAGTVALTAPAAYQSAQQSSGSATLTVAGTYTGTPTNIEYSTDGTTWATLQAGPTGGTFTGSPAVAIGTYTVSVRFSNDHTVTASVTPVKVGDVFALAGDSNQSGRGSTLNSYTASGGNGASAYRFTGSTAVGAWADGNDPTDANEGGSYGSPWPAVATALVPAGSRPVAFVTAADGGTGLFWAGAGNLWAVGQTRYTNLATMVTNAAAGGLRAVLWHMGTNDANVGGFDSDDFLAKLDAAADGWNAAIGGTPKVVASLIGPYGAVSAARLDDVRRATMRAWNEHATTVLPGPSFHDQHWADGSNVHAIQDAEIALVAARWARVLKAHFYSGADAARGPRLQYAAVNAGRTAVTLTFDATLATATPSASVFAVAVDGVAQTVSSASASGTTVTLTLSGAAPAGRLTVTYGSGNSPTSAVHPTDTATTAFPAEPFWDAVAGPAAAGGSAGVRRATFGGGF